MQEVLEYAEGVRVGAMRTEGLTHVTKSSSALVQRDVGLGSDEVRAAICRILDLGAVKAGVVDRSVADSLAQLTRRCENGYIRAWAGAVDRGDVAADQVELTARSLVSHLLDAGFSGDHLHGWLLASRDKGVSLPDLLAKADEMCRREPTEYEVLVPFTSLPSELASAAGDRYITWDAMSERLRESRVPDPPVRQGAGALIFRTKAREPKAAIGAVEIELRRLAARVAIGLSSKSVQPSGHVLVLNGARPRWTPVRSRSSEILVSSITRHGLLLPAARSETDTPLDDAFELLAAVETSTSWASVAAIWAAVEGLLARADEPGVNAADRMASVVAGGFVRAEMTQLIDVLAASKEPLAEQLGANSQLTQPQKLDLLARNLQGGSMPQVNDPADAAAIGRIEALTADPSVVMTRVRGYYRDSFRRLFNQRNLLLHGGRFDSVALPATMRTVPALVAAGIDRLVHAAMQNEPSSPFELAARADVEIGLLGTSGSRQLHRLLD
ncbi:MAG: hypothetical protein WAT47_13955 [Nostocoides sp.]